MKDTLLFNNTYEGGRATVLIVKEKKEYVAVCLEFDLEASAKTPEEERERINDYMKAWYDNIVENKLPETLLNRPAPKKYWNLLHSITKDLESQRKAQEGQREIKEQLLSPVFQSSSTLFTMSN